MQPEAKEVIEKIDVKEKVSVTRDNAKPVYLAEGVTLEEKQSTPLNSFQQKINGEKDKNQYILQGPEHFYNVHLLSMTLIKKYLV